MSKQLRHTSTKRSQCRTSCFEVAKSFGLLLLLLAASLWRSEDSSLTLGSPLVDKISTLQGGTLLCFTRTVGVAPNQS